MIIIIHWIKSLGLLYKSVFLKKISSYCFDHNSEFEYCSAKYESYQTDCFATSYKSALQIWLFWRDFAKKPNSQCCYFTEWPWHDFAWVLTTVCNFSVIFFSPQRTFYGKIPDIGHCLWFKKFLDILVCSVKRVRWPGFG